MESTEIGSHLLSLDDQSIRQVVDDLQVDQLCAVEEIGRNLQQTAAAKLDELFRSHFLTIDVTYPDLGINEMNVKRFADRICNITIQGWVFKEKEVAEFVQSNFHHLKAVSLKFGAGISGHLRDSWKNIETVVFNTMESDGNFCYHDDCLRYCDRLRCLKYSSFHTGADEQDKFNIILSQKYAHLESVHFDFRLEPDSNNWTRFLQLNTSIQSITIRFLNKDEQTILNYIKPIVDHAINLRKFYLLLDIRGDYGKPFSFAPIHEQLMILDQRPNFDHLGIDFGQLTKINDFERIASLGSLKSLVASHPDHCEILPQISRYANGIRDLHLVSSAFNSSCPMGNHRNLENKWKDASPNLEELHFHEVKNAYFLVSLFIARAPKLKRIYAQNCKIVFDRNVGMSLKKFNDCRAELGLEMEPLTIYTDQMNVASNYEFSLVKLKHAEFEATELNERNPFQSWLDDGICAKLFRGAEKSADEAMARSMESILRLVQ